MCKKYIIQIEQNQAYPFDGPKHNFQEVAVRKHIPSHGSTSENVLASKIELLLGLASPYFIRIQRVLQRKNKYFDVDYEYVSENLAKCPKITDPAFLLSVKEKLILLCQTLSESCIKIELRIEDVGITQEAEPKVFLTHSFEIVSENEKPNLRREYQLQLDKMLEAFVNFRTSIKAPSELSDYSARLDRKIAAIQDKIHRRKYGKSKSRDSSKQRAKSIDQHQGRAKKPNIVLESMTSKLSKTSESSGKTSYSFIDPEKVVKPKTHKFSFNDYTTSSHKLNESANREDSLTKRLSTALQKSKQTFKIYEKYFRRNNRL